MHVYVLVPALVPAPPLGNSTYVVHLSVIVPVPVHLLVPIHVLVHVTVTVPVSVPVTICTFYFYLCNYLFPVLATVHAPASSAKILRSTVLTRRVGTSAETVGISPRP